MDNKEKQVLLTAFNLVLIFGLYSLYVYHVYISQNPDIIHDFKFWARAFLILIPVTIISQIVIHILFAILTKIVAGEDLSSLKDERDKMIDLKAIRISHWIFTAGFFLAMVSQILDMPPYIMFLTLLFSGFLAGVVSEIAKFYFYRKGF
jgi:hypothetical protein